MKIVVGSESPHKLEAVRAACNELDIAATIRGVPAKSLVPEQPFGLDEMTRGAMNRSLHAFMIEPGADMFIGIESGIVDTTRHFVDMAAIVVRGRGPAGDGNVLAFATSPSVVYPDTYVTIARNRGTDCTVGAVMQEQVGANPTDPTSWLTRGRLSRAKTLVPGIVAALAQALAE